jgi:hypothetical protein
MSMYKWVLKHIGFHCTIALIYLGFTSYEFVIAKEANPIGICLLQTVSILAHFGLTGFIGLIFRYYSKDKKLAAKKIWIQLIIITGIILIYLFLAGPFWTWLWSLRKDIIQ